MPVTDISKELFAQYPDITGLSLTKGPTVSNSGAEVTEQVVAVITAKETLDREMVSRLERWLKARLGTENVIILQKD